MASPPFTHLRYSIIFVSIAIWLNRDVSHKILIAEQLRTLKELTPFAPINSFNQPLGQSKSAVKIINKHNVIAKSYKTDPFLSVVLIIFRDYKSTLF